MFNFQENSVKLFLKPLSYWWTVFYSWWKPCWYAIILSYSILWTLRIIKLVFSSLIINSTTHLM